MKLIKNYVKENYSLLFQHQKDNQIEAIFDKKGFSFTAEAQNHYNAIKNKPHLYVAWTNQEKGYYYIGKSFQAGGRWKRQHAYHLGTLAHHLLDTIRYDDQNHAHWIVHWMKDKTKVEIDSNLYSIELKKEVYISFIPFVVYSNQDFNTVTKAEIRKINTNIERQLIQSYLDDNIIVLNIQHNMENKL